MIAPDKKIDPFFSYMGNKMPLIKWTIPEIMAAPHEVYVEVFGGTFATGLNKPKSKVEIYNDYNGNLSNLFNVVRMRGEEFLEKWNKMIISEHWHRNIFYGDHTEYDDMENALRYYYIMSMTFMGKYTGGFFYKPEVSFTKMVEKKSLIIERVMERIQNVIFLNKHAFKVVEQNNREDTVLYLDPPYVNTESYYQALAGEFTRYDHIKLRDILNEHKGYWFLSYEDDEMVNDLYRGRRFIRKDQQRASNKTVVKEVLVTNYEGKISNDHITTVTQGTFF